VSGASGEILLNHKYVIDALQTIDKPVVVVKVVDEDSPVVFNPQGDASYLYLVMPIKN
jgi:DNA polymerase III sliding clamp (beta) subunit (PCNA family)